MDIFRSKEVYRKIRKRESGNVGNPIIPIRGMYVVGQYLIPEYKNSGIVIEQIRSTYPTIVDYTEASKSTYPGDSLVSLLTHTIDDSNMIITKYSTKSKSTYDDSIVSLYYHTIDGMVLQQYSQVNKSTYEDSIVSLYYHTIKDEHTIQYYYQPKLSSQPEPLMLILDIRNHEITITDV